jgi:tetratricopeptide (TPR) repeat protein
MEALRVIALAALDRERYADAAEAFSRVLAHARGLGSRPDEREILGWLEYCFSHGPTPVDEVLRWAEEESLPLEELEPAVTTSRAVLLAMDGRVAEAQDLCARADTRLQELGMTLWMAAHSEFAWHVEMLADDLAAAEQQARRGCAVYEEMESPTGLGLCAGMLAQTLCARGREEEAARWVEVSERNMPSDGISVDGGARRWRQVRAKIFARNGDADQAERMARQAVAIAEQTDSLRGQADALLDLAEVLELGDRAGEAAAATARALDLHKRKGIVVMVERAQKQLDARKALITAR